MPRPTVATKRTPKKPARKAAPKPGTGRPARTSAKAAKAKEGPKSAADTARRALRRDDPIRAWQVMRADIADVRTASLDQLDILVAALRAV